MNNYMSASKASEQIGCSVATVSRWCVRLGINRRYGSVLMLTEKEVEKIKSAWHKQPGNPGFGGKSPERN